MTISAQHPWCLRIMIFGSKWHQHLQLQLFPEIRPGWVGGGLVGELGKNAPKAPRFPHDFWEKKIVGNFFFTPSWPSKLSKVVYGHFGQPKTSFSQLWCLLCKLGGGLKQVLFLLLQFWLIFQMGWNHQLVSHWNVHSTFVYLSLFESLYLSYVSSALQVPNPRSSHGFVNLQIRKHLQNYLCRYHDDCTQ